MIGNSTPQIDYVENGATLAHPVPFQFQSSAEIACSRILAGVETLLTAGVDYTVTGGNGGTGTVTKTSGGTAGTIFRIKRATSRSQTQDYTAHGDFPAENTELALDRLAAVDQEQDRDLGDLKSRALQVPPGETIQPLAKAAERANKFPRFSAAGAIELLTSTAFVAAIIDPIRTALGQFAKGDPGGNVMAIGAFTIASTLAIPIGTDVVRTTSYSPLYRGLGIADYVYDPAVDAAYVAANPRRAFISTNGRGFRFAHEAATFLKPEQFGAIGDNATDDDAAFEAMRGVGPLLGYLHVQLRGGASYMVGKQVLNGNADGAGPYYYEQTHAIYANGLNSLIVAGDGATLKTNPGLKFGAFNPGTGAPVNYLSASPAPMNARASIGSCIRADACQFVQIDNVALDGNSITHTIGGTTSTNDTETRHQGLMLHDNMQAIVRNVRATNFLLDCLYISSTVTAADDPRPHLIENCFLDTCGRNVCSLTGGKGVVFVNTTFRHPANVPIAGGGVLSSAPRAAIDLEAQGGAVVFNVEFHNCRFLQGPNGVFAMVSEDSVNHDNFLVDHCTIVGQFYFAASRGRLRASRLFGFIGKLKSSPDADIATLIDDCFLTDATLGATPLLTATSSLFFSGATPTGAQLRNSKLALNRHKFNLPGLITSDLTIDAMADTTVFAAGSSIGSIGAGGPHTRLTINDKIAANFPAPPFFVQSPGLATMKDGNVNSATPYIKWVANDATGFAGRFDNYDVTGVAGVATNGDVAATLNGRSSKAVQRWTSPLTANRAVTLSTINVKDGDTFSILRTAAATGAFTLDVGAGLKSLAAGQWCRVVYDAASAAWQLSAFGAL